MGHLELDEAGPWTRFVMNSSTGGAEGVGSADSEALFATEDAVDLYTERVQDATLFPQEGKAFDRYFNEPNTSVLDVGCGVGRVASILAERGFEVTGIDVSEPFVERARTLFPEIEFRVEDIRDTSFDSRSFEYVVFSYYGLDYILPKAERLRALREIHRVLKPAGVLVFSTHNSWSPLVPQSLSDLSRAAKDLLNLYPSSNDQEPLYARQKTDRLPLGEIEIYLSDPVHQWLQLRKCGFTPLDVVGKRDNVLRFLERQPHYVAKK